MQNDLNCKISKKYTQDCCKGLQLKEHVLSLRQI